MGFKKVVVIREAIIQKGIKPAGSARKNVGVEVAAVFNYSQKSRL